MTITDDSTGITDLTIAPEVREVTSQDGAVLLDIEQGICFSLNPVGLKIWDLLKKKSSLDEIVAALAADFAVPRDQLRSDTCEFIESLRTKQLLRPAGKAASPKPGIVRSLFRRFHSTRTVRP